MSTITKPSQPLLGLSGMSAASALARRELRSASLGSTVGQDDTWHCLRDNLLAQEVHINDAVITCFEACAATLAL